MAGGMPSKHRPGRLPLSARPVVPPPQRATVERTVTGERAGATPRHCWVVGCEFAPGRWPGVLLEWQRTPHGWRGRVVLALSGDAGPMLLEAWLPAALLRPAST